MTDKSETTTTTTARIAPAAEGPQLTEQLNFLITPEDRAFLLGSRVIDGARSEATVARALLVDAIARFRRKHGDAVYLERVELGRAEQVRRAG